MPYINPDRAREINIYETDDEPITLAYEDGHRNEETAGELNYTLSTVIAEYVANHGLSYQTINDVSGAMTEALAEFRRRIVVPYEDVKRRTGVDPYAEIRPVSSGAIAVTERPDVDWTVRLRKGANL